jgi:hypothetical protein
MKRAVAIGLFLLPGLVHAVICKTVDAEGVVAYMELPADECRTRVELPEYSRYTPRPVQLPDRKGDSAIAAKQIRFEAYRSIQVVKPAADEEVSSDDGRVSLVFRLEPALQAGHRISVFLDDVPILGSFDGLEIELSGVGPGRHSVRAVVTDEDGRRLIDSQNVRFVLLKPAQVDAVEPSG